MTQVTMLTHALPQSRAYIGPVANSLLSENDDARRQSGASCVLSQGRALFWQGEPQIQNIELLQGVVRAVRLLKDGNRQILKFYWPGDNVPAQALSRLFTAEAVTPCHIKRCRPIDEVGARTDSGDAHHIIEEMLSLVLVMSKKSSASRIAWLLLRIRPYLPTDPRRPDCLKILLPRADMADHLGTSLETVCRTLAEFKAKGLIDLPTRKTIRYLNIYGLSRIAGA
jgi:CRP-like cAMP-binding protein